MKHKMLEKFKNINHKEKVKIKSKKLAKVNIGKVKRNNLEIEIIGDIEEIEGGIQLFAKVWKDKKQIGFGKDGTIDIERFRFFNPPILVADKNGDIIREWEGEDIETKKNIKKTRRLREDPKEALLQSLEHTISVMKNIHTNNNIIKGKIGNTTSTFYPAAGENSPVDGATRNSGTVFSTCRSAATGNFNSVTTLIYGHYNPAGSEFRIWRGIVSFNTSTIGDTDTIDSATLSLYANRINDGINDAYSYQSITGVTLDADDNISLDDYGNVGSTKYTGDLELTGKTAGSYYDFVFNSTGLSNVSKTGNTQLAVREGHDVMNQSTSISPDVTSGGYWQSADTDGTTEDPKLVVEHTGVVVASTGNFFQLF